MIEGQGNSEWMVDISGQQFGPYQGAQLAKWLQGDWIVPPQAVIHNGLQRLTPVQFLAQFQMLPPLSSEAPRAVVPSQVDNATYPPTLAPFPGPSTPPGPSPESPVLLAPTDEPPQPPTSTSPPVVDRNVPDAPAFARRDTDNDEVPERDQIVVIGRRRSGKTIFLASIYGKLWKSLDGMTAKALTGETHKELIEVNRILKQGQWPSATVGATQVAMELEYHHRKRLLVALDYAGEKFSDAFVKENTEDPVVKDLLRHIDRAVTVMLLIDPSVIAGDDMDAAVDDDFGMVQAVQRIRNWPGGDSVPIVLVLTKMDLHQHLIDRSGGAKEFVRQHFPALVRVLKEIPIFQVSAVQVEQTPDGNLKPRRDSALINVVNPLQYCLLQIDRDERAVQRQQKEEERQRKVRQMEMEEQRLERSNKIFWAFVIVAMFAVGLGLIALILVHRIG